MEVFMIWFTSDQHFSHYNIIEHCGRPFNTVEAMNRAIIDNFNALVNPLDEIYHLGDFTMKGIDHATRYLEALNGTHYHIIGNHDRKNMQRAGFKWSKDVHMLKYGELRVWLSHYSHRSWPKKHYGSIHLYGHSHGLLEFLPHSVDVGVDAHDFKPISIEDAVLFS
jgi:calcineurin-like phosphoesterase family protein